MIDRDEDGRELASLTVPRVGRLAGSGDVWEPWRLLDPAGEVVEPVAVWLRDLQAAGRSALTQRSYGMDLLRWFRFLGGGRGGVEPRHPSRGTRLRPLDSITDKPHRPSPDAGIPNPVTGKPKPGDKYAASTRGHGESVLRGFNEFHREAGSGPMVNPFPLARRQRRAHAHHHPIKPFGNERCGLYRPRQVQRVPHGIPDGKFNDLLAQLVSHRDRALVAFWVSSGARASVLLGCRQCDADPGQQLITVVRKGTRAVQQVPASPDAFVLEGPGDPPPWNRFAAPGARCRDRVETPDRQGDSP